MANILNLPDEVLLIIAKKLDFLSLSNFSKSCPWFTRFYQDFEITKNVLVSSTNTNQKPWCLFKSFLEQNVTNITQLNLSGVTWIKKNVFIKMLPRLTNLKDLNLTMTGIEMIDIEESINKLLQLRIIAITYIKGIFLTKDSCPVDHLTIDLELYRLKEFIWAIQVFRCLSVVSIKICIRNCIQFKCLSAFLNLIPATISTIRCKKLYISDIPLLQCNLEELKILSLSYLYTHYYIETSRGFYLSQNLCPDITDNPFVKRFDDVDIDYPKTHLMAICAFCENYPDLNDMESFVKTRIEKRMKITGLDFDSRCFLSKTKPMTKYMIDTNTYKELTISTVQLCSEVEEPAKMEPLFKKAKISHIPQASKSKTSTFEDLMANKKRVEFLNVRHNPQLCLKVTSGKNISCCSEHKNIKVIYDWDSLHVITGLSYLRHLSMSMLPNNCQLFAKQLFTNCKHLIILETESPKFDKIEAFAENIGLSQTIQSIHFKGQLRQIDGILECLSMAPTLQSIIILEKKDITMQPHRVTLLPLLNIIQRCKGIESIFIYQEDRPKCVDIEYKKFEKICKSKNKKLSITLSHPQSMSVAITF